MTKNYKVQVLLVLILFVGVNVFTQEKQVDEIQQLRNEILSVYKAQGKKGLRDFYQKNQEKITNKFIIAFAREGVDAREKEWLELCGIIAKKKTMKIKRF